MSNSALFAKALNLTVGAITGKTPVDIVPDNNPYRNKYQAYGAAKVLFESDDPEVVLSGPAGTGKTRANLEYIHDAMQSYPGARALIVRKTRASLSETALQTFEDHVLGADHPMAEGPQRPFRHSYRYPNDSQIIVGGMDKATRIMSSEYDLIFVQEAIELTLNDWESLNTRLRNGKMPVQRLIADTNPDTPHHWLKQRCDAGVTRMLPSHHEDNPILFDAVTGEWTERGKRYLSKLSALTGTRKQRLAQGLWVQAEGAIYEGWDEGIHLLPAEFIIPAEWRRIRSIDFGFTNPFVCQWWAIDPDGRMYLYREIYRTQRTVKVHSAEITRLSAVERYEATVADHDAEDRATLSENGIGTTPARKEVSVGIQAVQERIKVAADGKPRLFIVRGALIEKDPTLVDEETGIDTKPTSTLAEIGGYVWAKGPDGKPLKEEPMKVDDHGMDALRYAVMRIDKRSKAQVW